MKRLILSLSTLLFSLIALAQTTDDGYTNSVLPGWNTLCRPHPDEISLTERPGWLR